MVDRKSAKLPISLKIVRISLENMPVKKGNLQWTRSITQTKKATEQSKAKDSQQILGQSRDRVQQKANTENNFSKVLNPSSKSFHYSSSNQGSMSNINTFKRYLENMMSSLLLDFTFNCQKKSQSLNILYLIINIEISQLRIRNRVLKVTCICE